MRNIQLLFLFFCYFVCTITIAQNIPQQKMGLNKILELAEKKSLDAFKAKNLYQSSFWEFKNFGIQNLPTLSLDFNPLIYNSSVTQRFNSNLNRDEFRSVETINSYIGLSLSQNIIATGGNVFINSNINRLESFGTNANTSFNNNVVQVGFEQSLFQHNEFKWNKKIAPLVFEKAKIDFIESRETLHIKAVNFFFDLASAQLNKEISETNYINAKKLYQIGKERFKIATINQEDLLSLELNLLNAEVAQRSANKDLMDSQFSLNNFLGNEKHTNLLLEIPENILPFEISLKESLTQALENNSEMIGLKIKELNALRELDRVKKRGQFNPSLAGSIGLNKGANNFDDSFIDPLEQKRFSLRIKLPIVDWGANNRKTKIALNKAHVVKEENKQALKDFEQKITTQVIEFNLLDELVGNALKAKEIATKSHSIILERFKYGNVDIIKLNAKTAAKDRAINNYINSLKDYWVNYYTLQKMTLTNLTTKQKLSFEFDKELELN